FPRKIDYLRYPFGLPVTKIWQNNRIIYFKNTEFHFDLCRNSITIIENLVIYFNILKFYEKTLITKVLHKGVDKALNEFRQEV
ncbi:MAG: hypothetical protein K2Y07_09075, partial [Nitrosomonas sp.]|nr:hypothetical protein [Nitrosomonas sp.]